MISFTFETYWQEIKRQRPQKLQTGKKTKEYKSRPEMAAAVQQHVNVHHQQLQQWEVAFLVLSALCQANAKRKKKKNWENWEFSHCVDGSAGSRQ